MVKFVKLNPKAHIPTQGSKMAAGYDLYACIPSDEKSFVHISPHSTVKIGTGLAIQPPCGYFGAIFARSGFATKQGLRPANCVGVADYDYTGEYIVAIHIFSEYRLAHHYGNSDKRKEYATIRDLGNKKKKDIALLLEPLEIEYNPDDLKFVEYQANDG